MNLSGVRSPGAKLGGIVYLGRMIDKIRVHARGELPEDYQANLGRGFDHSCAAFLQIDYSQFADCVKEGRSDEEMWAWCFEHGRKPGDDEIHVWNEYMRKRGWDDDISVTLTRRKEEAGLGARADIRTMFDFIDADEGRLPRGSRAE